MINAAIVGLGRWGRNHVNAVAGSSRIRYVRAVTRNPGGGAGLRRPARASR